MKPEGAGFILDYKGSVLRGVETPDIEFGYDCRLYVVDMKSGFMTKNDGRLLAFWDPVENQAPIVKEVTQLFGEGIENLTSERLAQLLAHKDMRVRLRAEWELTTRKDSGRLLLAATAAGQPLLKRLHAEYGLVILACKNNDTAALNRVIELTGDSVPLLRARAAQALGELTGLAGKKRVAEVLLPLLKDTDSQVQMLAAIAIGKTGEAAARAALFELLGKSDEANLRYGAVLGLVGLGDPEALVPRIGDANVGIRRGVLLALRRLHSKSVEQFLTDPDPSLVREAIQAIHDGRIAESYPALAKRTDLIGKFGESVNNRIICAQLLVGSPGNLRVLLDLAADTTLPTPLRLEAFWFVRFWEKPLAINPVTGVADPALLASRRMVETKDKEELSARLIALTAKNEPALLSEALATLDAFKITLPTETQRAIFLNQKNPTAARLLVFETLGPLPDLVAKGLGDTALEVRMRALDWFARSDEAAALERIERGMKTAAIREKQLQVALLGRLTSATSALKLNGWLEQIRQMPPEVQTEVLTAGAARTDCAEAYAKTQAAFKAEADRLAPFRSTLTGGDPLIGRKLFYNSAAAMCSRCHKAEQGIGGGLAGPPLMGVQAKGEDYLLRAVVEPSADFATGYAAIALTLKSGETVAGVLIERDANNTKIKLADGKEIVIEAETIASASAPVSPMPPMGAVLSLSEVRDVVAFLKTLTPENHETIKAKKERPLQLVQKAAQYLDIKPQP